MRVLAERNRAFERLFTIVLAVLLVGSVALTLFASRLVVAHPAACATTPSTRSTRRAACAHRWRAPTRATRSATCRAASRACSRGWPTTRATRRRWRAACRTSCARRSPWCAARSRTCKAAPFDAGRARLHRARAGRARPPHGDPRAHDRGHAARAGARRCRARALRCRRASSPAASRATGSRIRARRFALVAAGRRIALSGAPELIAQMLDKLVENAVEFATGGAIDVAARRATATPRLAVANEGPPLPAGMRGAAVRIDGVGARRRGAADGAASGARALHRAADRAVPRRHGDGGESERPAGRNGQRPRAARHLTSSRAALGMADASASLRWRGGGACIPSSFTRNAYTSASSAMRVASAVPMPWPGAGVGAQQDRPRRRCGGLQPRRHLARFVRRDAAVVVARGQQHRRIRDAVAHVRYGE